jgi:hypothetical protein
MAVYREVALEVEEQVLAAALDPLEDEAVEGGRRETLGPASARCPRGDSLSRQRGVDPSRHADDRVPLGHD